MGLFDFLKKKEQVFNINAKDIKRVLAKHDVNITEELINDNRALLEESITEMLKLNIDSESDHPKIKQIGRKLSLCDDDNYFGEIRLMQIVYYAIIGKKGDGRNYSLSGLWSYIGGWRN